MFEALFIDLPLALIGYALIVFILMKVQGDLVHDAEGVTLRSRIDGPGSTRAHEDMAKTNASGDESQHQTVQGAEALSAYEPNHSLILKRTGGDLLALPQDASLRRHAIQSLAAAWERQYPRPTDPTLRRHYDQWLASEFESLSNE